MPAASLRLLVVGSAAVTALRPALTRAVLSPLAIVKELFTAPVADAGGAANRPPIAETMTPYAVLVLKLLGLHLHAP